MVLNNIESEDFDILNKYLIDISKYSVLSSEEEKKAFLELKKIDNINIVNKKEVNGINVYSLKINDILVSLCDDEKYYLTLDLLLSLLKKSNKKIDAEYLKIFKKYKKYTLELNRNLTKEEVINFFKDYALGGVGQKDLYGQVTILSDYKNNYDKIFNSNLKLVVSVAKRYKAQFELIDLINEGNIGLMTAIDKFDISKGFKFSTYAIHHIKNRIYRAISDKKSLIRIPNKFFNDLLKFNREVEALEKQLGHKPSVDEVSKYLSMPKSKVNEYFDNSFIFVSLDQPIDEDESTRLVDNIESKYNLDEEINLEQLKEDIKNILNDLTINNNIDEIEVEILKMKFGLDEYSNFGYKTSEEVGQAFGLSKSDVNEVIKRVLRRIKFNIIKSSKYQYIKNYSR